jgi:hypothetical protein
MSGHRSDRHQDAFLPARVRPHSVSTRSPSGVTATRGPFSAVQDLERLAWFEPVARDPFQRSAVPLVAHVVILQSYYSPVGYARLRMPSHSSWSHACSPDKIK